MRKARGRPARSIKDSSKCPHTEDDVGLQQMPDIENGAPKDAASESDLQIRDQSTSVKSSSTSPYPERSFSTMAPVIEGRSVALMAALASAGM